MKMFQGNTIAWLLLHIGLLSYGTIQVDAAKVLIYPVDTGFNSRAINMAKLGTYLKEDGHQVSMIMNQAILDRYNPDHLNIIKYELPKNIRLVTDPDVLKEFEDIMNSYFSILKASSAWGDIVAPFCEALVSDRTLIHKLKEEKFDLLLADMANECTRIVADYLDIPTILYSNHGFFNNDVTYPRLTSIVCDSVSTSCSGDQMTFGERLVNFVLTGINDNFLYPQMLLPFREIREKYGLNTSLSIDPSYRYGKSLILINVDFVMEYPRPLMPHVFPISGLYYREPKPLPSDLADMIKDSVYDDVVVVSFGTLIDKVPAERAEIMAHVFSKLPALVLWRFTATPPKALGDNTKLVGWFPQFDVLAQPKTTLFVTHCGVSASFEAASLGLPVLGVPFLGDQRYHCLQLVKRLKMGVMTDWVNFSEESFERDLLSVFKNESFQDSAKKTADLMNDRPISPKKQFLHLVNYTIKHDGAEHLISKPGRRLNVFQFYSVDVVAFIVFVLLGSIFVMYMTCKLISRTLKWASPKSKLKGN